MKIVRLVLLGSCIGICAFGASCSIFKSLFNAAPEVALSGPANLVWNTPGTFESNATDADKDELTFTWYINDIVQSDISKTSTSIRFWASPDNETRYTVKVDVTDGISDPVSSSMTVTVGSPAKLLVKNNTGYSISFLYYRQNTSSGWSSDLLGSSTLPYLSSGILFNLIPGGYYFRAETSPTYSYYWETVYSTLTAGQTSTWTIGGGSYSLAGPLIPSESMTNSPTFSLTPKGVFMKATSE